MWGCLPIFYLHGQDEGLLAEHLEEHQKLCGIIIQCMAFPYGFSSLNGFKLRD